MNLTKLAGKYGTDKGNIKHRYTKIYAKYFEAIRKQELNILEIGINYGASIHMWSEYFPNSKISCMDIIKRDEILKSFSKRITPFIGDQSNPDDLQKIIDQNKHGFDIIIDDGSHRSEDHQLCLNMLYPILNKNGFYAIEDLQTKRTHSKTLEECPNTLSMLKTFIKTKKIISPLISTEVSKMIESSGRCCELYMDKLCIIKRSS